MLIEEGCLRDRCCHLKKGGLTQSFSDESLLARHADLLQIIHTFLSRVDSGNRSKWPFSQVVVNPNLDLERGEGLNALIFKDVSGCFSGGYGCLHPACGAVGSKSHHIAKARSVLQLFRNRLQENNTV